VTSCSGGCRRAGNGPTPREISEILLHTALFAGVPASNAAFAIAQRTLQEMGVPEAEMQRRD
jgi:4-carboxymuconolactone decarboxylase